MACFDDRQQISNWNVSANANISELGDFRQLIRSLSLYIPYLTLAKVNNVILKKLLLHLIFFFFLLLFFSYWQNILYIASNWSDAVNSTLTHVYKEKLH